MLNSAYKDGRNNIWVRERTDVISHASEKDYVHGFTRATTSKTTDGPRKKPHGNRIRERMTRETMQSIGGYRRPEQIYWMGISYDGHNLIDDSA